MVPRHCSTSEGQVTTGPEAVEVVVAASSVVVSAFDVVKEVRKAVGFDSVVPVSVASALEAVSVADSVRFVSTVVSVVVGVVDPMRVAEAEAVDEAASLAEAVLLGTDTTELERLSGLHLPADAMPTAAESIKRERMATMMEVKNKANVK
jgi:hypothetical protein